MKFLKTEGSLSNTAHIECLRILPRYSYKGKESMLTHWVVEALFSSGSSVDLRRFDSEHDAQNYLNDLVIKLGIEVVMVAQGGVSKK